MNELTIITNNVPRDVVDAWELTPKERAEFDYLDWDAIERGEDSASFVRYKGEILDLSEFEVWSNRLSLTRNSWHGWDGFRSDSFFSGLVIRYCDNFERVIVGRYYS